MLYFKYLLPASLLLVGMTIYAQSPTNHAHTNNWQKQSIASSSNHQTSWSNSKIESKLDSYKAARFLNSASLGADYETIQALAQQGIPNWLDDQFATPPQVSFRDTTWMIWEHFYPQYIDIWGYDFIVNHGDAVLPYWYYWKMAWWNNILKSDDHLRQRVTQALSQIFVISE